MKKPRSTNRSFTKRYLDENGNVIVRVAAKDVHKLRGRTNWAALDALTDGDIAKAVAEDPDAVSIDADWSRARLYFPKLKR